MNFTWKIFQNFINNVFPLNLLCLYCYKMIFSITRATLFSNTAEHEPYYSAIRQNTSHSAHIYSRTRAILLKYTAEHEPFCSDIQQNTSHSAQIYSRILMQCLALQNVDYYGSAIGKLRIQWIIAEMLWGLAPGINLISVNFL